MCTPAGSQPPHTQPGNKCNQRVRVKSSQPMFAHIFSDTRCICGIVNAQLSSADPSSTTKTARKKYPMPPHPTHINVLTQIHTIRSHSYVRSRPESPFRARVLSQSGSRCTWHTTRTHAHTHTQSFVAPITQHPRHHTQDEHARTNKQSGTHMQDALNLLWSRTVSTASVDPAWWSAVDVAVAEEDRRDVDS